MRRRTRIVAAVVLFGGPVLLLLGVLLYLRFADLSGWRDIVADAVSDALGRRVTISGEFDPEIGRTIRITAGEITLANADWSDEPVMLSVDHLVVELDLLSLLSGPLSVSGVRIEGARALLEKSRDGRSNWQLDTTTGTGDPRGPLELELGRVSATDLTLVYRDPKRPAPVRLVVSSLSCGADRTEMLDLSLTGDLQDRELALQARLGPLDQLLGAGSVRHTLEGELGGVRLSSSGTIDHLASFSGVRLMAEAAGRDLAELHELIPFVRDVEGAFRVAAEVAPGADGSLLRLDAAVGELTIAADGSVDSLLRPRSVDGTVDASGPSIRALRSLLGAATLPDEPFVLSAGLRWQGFPITLRHVELRVGDNTLLADGVVGSPPAMAGTELRIDGSGPDLARLAALAGLRLPAERYSISGQITRIDGGLEVESLEATIGAVRLTLGGRLGEPPEYTGTDLEVHAAGPSLARFSGLVGFELPDQPFAADGHLAEGRAAIRLQDVQAHVGSTALAVDGHLVLKQRLVGSDLAVHAEGPDASLLGNPARLAHPPTEPWAATGRVKFVNGGLHLDGVSASIGELRVRGDGFVATTRRALGTDLELHVEDARLSHVAAVLGRDNQPDVPIRAAGRLRVVEEGYIIGNAKATIGDVELEADGVIGTGPQLDGTRIRMSGHGPSLASVGPVIGQPSLPAAPFAVAGDLRASESVWSTTGLEADVDGNRLTVVGSLAPVPDLAGTDLELELTGPDLHRAGALAAGLVEVPELPGLPYSLSTRFAADPDGYLVHDLRATLGTAESAIDGRVGRLPDLVGTDLTIDVNGPDASLLQLVTGETFPVAPFLITGRIQRTPEWVEFEDLRLRLGDSSVRLDGRLGEPPRLSGTALDLDASGPRSGLIWRLAGLEGLPDEPFQCSGRFEGTVDHFSAEQLVVSFGASRVRGALDVAFGAKPTVVARLESDLIDLSPYLAGHSAGELQAETQPSGNDSPSPSPVFGDEPVDLSILRLADADVEIDIQTLRLPLKGFHDVRIGIELDNGRLAVRRFEAAGRPEGRGAGSLVLEPEGDGYRLFAEADLDSIRLDPPGATSTDPLSRPRIDLDVQLEASGRSPHELAVSSTGWIQLTAGAGIMDNSILDAVSAPIIATLLDAFNPFTRQERTSQLQCAVVFVTLGDGMATLDPMVLKSNRMTMLGEGSVNLDTERLNLQWVTKPRKGIGLSASMLTNPYIRLGGTLSRPSLQLKEADAAVSTGAAVATAGISLAARGLWDRITAEKNVCKKALKKIGPQ